MVNQPFNSNLTTSGQKSTSLLLNRACCLAFAGFVPIPLTPKEGKLVPSIPWKDFSLPDDPLEAVEVVQKLFSKGDTAGIAIKTGEPSGLVVLDIDAPEKFNSFYPLERLIEEAPYVVKTKDRGHLHVGFSWEPDLAKSRSFLRDYGFEIKSNGSLANFFSTLPEAQYKPIKLEPLKPMPKELKDKLLSLMGSQREAPENPNQPNPEGLDPSKIIELVSEVYQKGCRQFWTIYVAGYLRKLGFSFEEAKEALEAFLQGQGDEELEMRLAGVEHTYKEPIENVKGLSGLLELGLSEEVYLKLQALKIQRRGTQAPKCFTIKEILSLKVKEPSWLIPNLLPEGFSILGGKPKIGKSWLALQIALSCAQMGKRVAYFALEDSPGRLQKRLKTLGLENPEGLPEDLIFFYFELPRIGKGAVKEIRRCIEEHSPELIIIDPWAKIKPQVKGKDLFLEEYRALEVLKELVKEGSNILLIHHARKTQSEDPIDEILGSTGQTAVVDNILVLKRGRGDKTAVLHLILRDFEGADLGLRFENGWKLEGSAKEVMLAEEQRKIVEAIKSLESMGEKATIKAIAELVGKNTGAVKKALFDLLQKGAVSKKERGVYSLLDTINTKGSNFSNLSNFSNFSNLGNFLCQPSPIPQKVTSVTSWVKNEVTIPDQNLQGLQEKVTKVTKVTNVSSFIQTPTPDPDPDPEPTPDPDLPFDTKPKGTPDRANEPLEEGTVYLLMPEEDKCPVCECEVWKVARVVYMLRRGVGICARCGHMSWFGDFGKGRVLESKADVEYFLAELTF